MPQKKQSHRVNNWAIASSDTIAQVIDESKRKAAIAQRLSVAKVTDDVLDKLWKPESEPQLQAFNHPADELLFGGAAGGGKAQPCYGLDWALKTMKYFKVDAYGDILPLIPEQIRDMDSKVLTWNGLWKAFSELTVGDRIMNPDGQVQRIIQVHERGLQQTYRVKFEDNTFVECSGDHIWGFWEARSDSRRKTRPGKKDVLETSDPKNWNINYISRARMEDTTWMFEEVSKGRRFIIPINAPLNYTQLTRGEASRAYLYGALIGDGTIQSFRFGSGIRLCSSDNWIIERCLSLSEKYYIRKPGEGQITFDITFRDEWVSAWARNSGLLGKYSHDKFLPEAYLNESLKFRWNLAQGLFDTDGYASMALKNEVSYCTVSPELAIGVANLVRSLGYMAKIREKQGVCYSVGYEGEKRMAYIVSVEGNDRHKLFSLPRKVSAAMGHEPNILVGKRITEIEKLDAVYSRCITVSNPNGLYVTDGYNVTHNSALLLILAVLQHKRSIIFRREYPRLKDLIEKSRRLLGGIARYNSNDKIWRGIPGDRTLEFGAVQYEDDVEAFRGVEHDLKCFDELGEFSREQYNFLITWNRSPDPKVRSRVVATCNPPSNVESEWIIDHWAAWLKPDHPNPAAPGELRWYAVIDGEEVEVPDGAPVLHKGEEILPRSRSFIPARLEDNAYLRNSNYKGVLQRLPEPFRSQLLYGDFTTIKRQDHEWQVIPSDWLDKAFSRWTPTPPRPQSHIGVDVARGGLCESTIVPRHGFWIAPIIALPGQSTPNGETLADQIVLVKRSPKVEIRIDVVGVGSSAYDVLVHRGIEPVFGLNGGGAAVNSEGLPYRDASGSLEFFNLRSFWIWRIRELLDPVNNFNLALPPDKKLEADLLALRWRIQPSRNKFGQIRVESKDEIIKRLGRSPDRGDGLMYALAEFTDDITGYEWLKNL